jgi:hypothetical protein
MLWNDLVGGIIHVRLNDHEVVFTYGTYINTINTLFTDCIWH